MPVTLTDKDLEDLARVVDDFRHKEAVALFTFLSPRIQAQRMEEMKAKAAEAPKPELPAANGHAEP